MAADEDNDQLTRSRTRGLAYHAGPDFLTWIICLLSAAISAHRQMAFYSRVYSR